MAEVCCESGEGIEVVFQVARQRHLVSGCIVEGELQSPEEALGTRYGSGNEA